MSEHEGDCCESCLQDIEFDPVYALEECCCKGIK